MAAESFPLPPTRTDVSSKLKARLPSSVYSELATPANAPSSSHTVSHSAGCLYSRPHWVIDSRGGIIEPQEERNSAATLWGHETASRRELSICKVTQADMTPVQIARALVRHTQTCARSHLLAAMLADAQFRFRPNENTRFWLGCF